MNDIIDTSSGKQYYAACRCSKCGEINVVPYYVTGAGSESYDWKDRRNKAAKTADGATVLNSSISVFEKSLSERNYVKTGIDGKCKSCGHREPWALSSKVPKFFGVLAGIGLGFAFLCGIAGFGTHKAWLYGLIALGFAALQIVILVLLSKSKKKRAEDTPAEDLPIVAESPEQLQKLVSERWGGTEQHN